MSGTYSTHGTDEKCIKCQSEHLSGKDNLEDLEVDRGKY